MDADENNKIPKTLTLQPNESREIPSRIGNYKVLEVIGRGGMGTVYLAQQEKPIKRKVAIKVVKPGMDSKEIIARFESEQQALAMMNHPNIAQVYDSGQTEHGYPYFVMEYVPGLPITGYCDKYKMTTQERLKLFQAVCDAVQHAHFKGIVHRDIKPSNVMVSFQDNKHVPKIIDFGVAKALAGQGLTDKTLHTQHGLTVGTPVYMSPEQADLTAYDIDTRTDVYSLGVLLYELLVGTTPFDNNELQRAGILEILRVIREVDPPKPSIKLYSLGDSTKEIARKRGISEVGLRRQLQGDLEWIVMKALEKDRRRRYASAMDLAADIDRFLNKEPIQARPPKMTYKAIKYIRRHKAASFAASSILLLIILSSFWNMIERRKTDRSLRESNYNFAVALKEKAKIYEAENRWPLVKLFTINSILYQAISQKYIPMGDIEIPIGYQDWILRDRLSSPSTILGDNYNDNERWSISPDGKYLALLGPRSVQLWDISGKRLLKDYKFDGRSIRISPDGKYMAFSGPRIVQIWNIQQDKEVASLEAHKNPISSICFSPDAKYLASVSSDVTNIWEIPSGIAIASFKSPGYEGDTWRWVLVMASSDFSPDGKYLAVGIRGVITIFDILSKKDVKRLSGRASTDTAIFSPDGKNIAFGRGDTIKILDISNEKEILTLIGHKGEIKGLSFSPDGQFLASASSDQTVRIWDLSSGKTISVLNGTLVKFFSNGKCMAILNNESSQLEVWEVSGFRFKAVLEHQKNSFGSLQFSPNGKYLASSPSSHEIIVWDLSNWKEAIRLVGYKGDIGAISISPDGLYLAAACSDSTIKIRRKADGQEISSFVLDQPVSISFSPDGKLLAAGYTDGPVEILEMSSGKVITDLCGLSLGGFSTSFSPDGKFIAGGDSKGKIQIWDVATRKPRATLSGHKDSIYSLCYSNDGKYLASGSADKTIKIWNILEGKEAYTLRGHLMEVRSVCFSPNDKYLVSGGFDNAIKIWDVSEGRELATLKSHSDRIGRIVFHPKEMIFASSSQDGYVKVWDLSYFLKYLWIALDYPYKKDNVVMISNKIEQETGYELEGMVPADVGSYLNAASEFIDKREYGKAIEIFNKILKTEPNFTNALNGLGKTHLLNGEYDEALDCFQKAIEIDKWCLDAQFNLGLAHLALHNYDKAYEQYRFMVRDIEADYRSKDKALESITQFMNAKNDEILPRLFRGYILKQRERLIEAKEDLDKFLSGYYPEDKWKNLAKGLLADILSNPDGLSKMGSEYEKNGEFAKAIELYEAALKLKPNYPEYLRPLGGLYYQTANYQKSILYYDKLIEINKLDPDVRYRKALSHLALMEFDKAYEYFRTATEQLKGLKDEFGIREFGWRPGFLILNLGKLIQNKPDLTFAYFLRGYIYLRSADFVEAKNDIELFLKKYKGMEKWKKSAKELLAEITKLEISEGKSKK